MEKAAMRRSMVRAFGGPEQLTVEPADEALEPGTGELLVDVEAAGVNYLDVMHRQGLGKLPLPFTPGMEGVGRVRGIGKGTGNASAVSVGQRVAWINLRGSYASQLLIPVEQAIPVPDAFTVSQALLFQAMTAQYLVSEYRDVRPGDRVLVHAAAGGVGQLLVQWLKHLGAWVVGTTSSKAKAAVARAAGADAVINYGRDYDFLDELRVLTDGRGVDLAFDSIGAATLAATLKGLAKGGTAVSFGSASGPPSIVNPLELINPCIRVAGGSVFSYVADPAELQRRAAVVVEAIRAGWLRIPEGTAYDLGQASDAHRDIEGRGVKGKLYLTP
ncbi:quinone oxidoreductase family protein [Roseomonas marmotae]|uniref:Quinone oxidoreductase n=1 Tax=Roseomonas marmotae TaxID=2768161 RepID=A0ABS3K8I6_9PROT|nr:quinone oxidoreductase [Roseomonas marmotae]MBO1073235.1 quinone oxidoreductase [Roseomonas marmotae]QTI79140.1 quinone oxidoreductase [Roseomonas marmotae]